MITRPHAARANAYGPEYFMTTAHCGLITTTRQACHAR